MNGNGTFHPLKIGLMAKYCICGNDSVFRRIRGIFSKYICGKLRQLQCCENSHASGEKETCQIVKLKLVKVTLLLEIYQYKSDLFIFSVVLTQLISFQYDLILDVRRGLTS